jgi:hypothetical protein
VAHKQFSHLLSAYLWKEGLPQNTVHFDFLTLKAYTKTFTLQSGKLSHPKGPLVHSAYLLYRIASSLT